MDDLEFILPCGFTMQYGSLFSNEKAIKVFLCPFCKSHYISNLEYEHFQNLKNKVDLRREEIKIFLNKKIDDYYENLLLEIEREQNSSLAKINKEFERILLFEKETDDAEIMENLDTKSKIELMKKIKEKVISQINVVNSALIKLSQASLAFERGDENLDVQKLFGKISLRKETNKSSPIKEPMKISSEQSLNFVIGNFSKLEKMQKIELKTKPFLIPNFEWSTFIELNQNTLIMDIYLKSNSVEYKDCRSVNIQAVLRLIHKTYSKYDYATSFNQYINQNEISSTCLNFFKFKNIIDPKNGYYRIEDDSIRFEASINTNSAWNLNRSSYNNNYQSDTDYDS
ncbi:hypothetical protein BpHYR1_016509 [Brachionus plicatilis]|uniref:MATH domain-containing protein n=1 Tax=Brachionus plicatilis TaxID=10195 RepID=A0A3M7R7E1_BRAPC|nr:hypothetical protein BpHYR1_016509 [Brachionus plicatilis]